MKKQSRWGLARGFSLIELMMVIVIVSILTAIAYPSYMKSVTKSRRSVALAALQDIANLQEQYFLNNKAYTADFTDIGLVANYYINNEGTLVAAASSDRVYQITLANVSTTAFDVVATPQLAQASNDTLCGTMTLSRDGTRAVSGTGTVSDCW